MNSSAQPFLNAQLDLYVAQTQAAESVVGRPQAIDHRDVEDTIAFGLAIYASLRRHSKSWADDIAAGKANSFWETSRHISDQFRWWKDRTAVLLKVVDVCKAKGYTVASEAELRSCFKDVSLMMLDTDRVRALFESNDPGGELSHSEAMDELRRRVAARRA